MHKALLFGVLVVAATLGFTALANEAECSVEAVFVSPSIDHVIESRIIEAIDNATWGLLIALYSFTNDHLGDAVIRAHQRGVNVRILLDDEQEEAEGGEYPKLVAAGIPVMVEHVTGRMHHNFAVIGADLVITGSYNWSDSVDEKNFENVVFITCKKIAFEYTKEFIRIWTALEAGRTP